LNGSWRRSTARLDVRNAEYAAINTIDVTYVVNITIRPDVLLTSCGGPVNRKQIGIFSNGKGTVPGFGLWDWLNVLDVVKWV
jgi:hypothetical protein